MPQLSALSDRASRLAKECPNVDVEPSKSCYIECEKGKVFCQRAAMWLEDVLRDDEFGSIAHDRMNWTVRALRDGKAGKLYSKLYELLCKGNDLLDERAASLNCELEWRIIDDRREHPPKFESLAEYAKMRRAKIADALADPFRQLAYVNQEAVCDATRDPLGNRLMGKLSEAQLTLGMALGMLVGAHAATSAEIRPYLIVDPTATGESRTEWQKVWQEFERVWISPEATDAAAWTWLAVNLCCFAVPPRYDVFDGVPEVQQRCLWAVATSGGIGPIPAFVYAVRDGLRLAGASVQNAAKEREALPADSVGSDSRGRTRSQIKQLCFLSLFYVDAIRMEEPFDDPALWRVVEQCRRQFLPQPRVSAHLAGKDFRPLTPQDVADVLRSLPTGRYSFYVEIRDGLLTPVGTLPNDGEAITCVGLRADTDLLRLLAEDIRAIDPGAALPLGIESHDDLLVRMKANDRETIVAEVENWWIDRRDELTGRLNGAEAQGADEGEKAAEAADALVERKRSMDENSFCKEGDTWRVTFGGKSTPGLADRDGMIYIACLLRTPDRRVDVDDLWVLTHPGDADEMKRLKCANVLDKPIRKADRDYVEELGETIQEGRDCPDDPAAQAAANDARKKLPAMLPQLQGHRNEQDTHRKRVADLVKKAIDRVRYGMKDHNKELALHLLNKIHTGYSCVYYSDADAPSWVVDMS
ncbi:MAG TPA: hypothetical protein VM141_09525 [Planctomycetota bacterium]|nr:hypothetical protein [Planctomycetota bacterium]